MPARLLGTRFWIPAYAALGVGLCWPGDHAWMRPSVPWVLGAILFFTCLRIPFGELRGGLCRPVQLRRAAWMTLLKLLLLPLAVGGLARCCAPEWTTGLVLVSLMPAGLSTVMLVDMQAGDRVLALLLTALGSLLAPWTVPAGLALLSGHAPTGSGAEQTTFILVLLLVPIVAAQVVRAAAPRLVERGLPWWGRLAMLAFIAMALIGTACNRGAWTGWSWGALVTPLVGMTGITLVALVSAWPLRRFLPAPVATTYACGVVNLNGGLAIAYATRFHPGDPYAILPAVLLPLPTIAAIAWWRRHEITIQQKIYDPAGRTCVPPP